MKSKKLIFTLLSAAIFGLTSVALQAQEEAPAKAPGGDRVQNQWGKNADRPQLSEDLQKQVEAFRQTRNEMLRAYREQFAPVREEIHALMVVYMDEDTTEERKAEIMAEVKVMKDGIRETVRANRDEIRMEMRQLRQKIREELQTPPET